MGECIFKDGCVLPSELAQYHEHITCECHNEEFNNRPEFVEHLKQYNRRRRK